MQFDFSSNCWQTVVGSHELRKYISTCCQVLDLTTNEMEWVASHLGHTMDVEKTYYRMMSGAIEKAKIAKLLMLADCGRLDKFQGKKLSDLKFDGMFYLLQLCSTQYGASFIGI